MRLAKIPSGGLVVYHHADVGRAGYLSLRVLVVPADLRRRVPVNVALQYLRGAVLGLHGDRLVPELRPVCENFQLSPIFLLQAAQLDRITTFYNTEEKKKCLGMILFSRYTRGEEYINREHVLLRS